MPQTAISPFKTNVKSGVVIEPPLEILKHSSSPTKRSFSRPGMSAQLSPSKVRSRSPEKPKKRAKIEITPELVWHYVQLAYNITMVIIGIIVLGMLVHIFRNDVRNRVETQSSSVIFEIEECARNYMHNKCMPSQRVPALDELCSKWEKCMNMDPEKVLHSQVFAEAVSDAIASFLGALSWKSLAFLLGGSLGIPLVVNCLGRRR